MRTVARRHLVSLGYRVSEAGSGPAALEILQGGRHFDLLFTDVVMPDGMTGYQLAAAARQSAARAQGAVHHRLSRPDLTTSRRARGRRHDPQAVPQAGTRGDGAGRAGGVSIGSVPARRSGRVGRLDAGDLDQQLAQHRLAEAPVSRATTTNESGPPMTLSR